MSQGSGLEALAVRTALADVVGAHAQRPQGDHLAACPTAWSWLRATRVTAMSIEAHPDIGRWFERMGARPTVREAAHGPPTTTSSRPDLERLPRPEQWSKLFPHDTQGRRFAPPLA